MESIPILSGMNLHIIPSVKFTTDIVCMLIRRPLLRTEVTANALLPSVLMRGTASYPCQTNITLAAERLRGSILESQIIKKGEQQILQCYFECVSDETLRDEGLVFLREIILNPLTEGGGFKSAYVRGESENLRQRIESRVNNKSDYAKQKCIELMCEGEPFALYGDGYAEDLSGVNSVEPQGLFRHYKRILAASPVDFIAIGRWDAERLRERLALLFSIYREDMDEMPVAATQPGRSERRMVSLEAGAAQGNMCVGLRGACDTAGEGYIHFQLANEILGGGANAKLFVNVREKESLCYQIKSTAYRFKGLLLINCGVDAKQFDHTLELIEAQIHALKQGEITNEEMDNAKRSLIKRWRSLQDDPGGCIDFYASQYLLNDNETIDQMITRVESAHKDGVVEASARLTLDTVVTLA